MSPRGIPARVMHRYADRERLVRVVVYLRAGQLEDLEVLIRHREPDVSRSEIVRRAVSWLLTRSAADLIRLHEMDARRAQRAAEEARALTIARQDRDEAAEHDDVTTALRLARGQDEPQEDVGC